MIHEKMLARCIQELKDQGDLYTLGDILEGVTKGTMQGFVRNDTWVVTQVCVYPRRKILDILLLVGDLADAEALEPEVVKFARDAGVTQLRTFGRDGWRDAITRNGWRSGRRVLHKDI